MRKYLTACGLFLGILILYPSLPTAAAPLVDESRFKELVWVCNRKTELIEFSSRIKMGRFDQKTHLLFVMEKESKGIALFGVSTQESGTSEYYLVENGRWQKTTEDVFQAKKWEIFTPAELAIFYANFAYALDDFTKLKKRKPIRLRSCEAQPS